MICMGTGLNCCYPSYAHFPVPPVEAVVQHLEIGSEEAKYMVMFRLYYGGTERLSTSLSNGL